MGTKTSLGKHSVIAFMVIVGWLSVSPSRMAAQSPGNKAVWNSTTVTGSTVWVDASAWWDGKSAPDLCGLLANKILTSTYGGSNNYPNGTVIDARGLVFAGTATTCMVDPFSALTAPPPSTTILLPSGYIDIMKTWTIPNNTRIVGDEQGTRIRANFNGPYMIEMGGIEPTSQVNLCPSSGCTSVGLEHVFLDGSKVINGSQVLTGGIDNQHSQAGSYVNDVNLWLLADTGLSIGTGATNSGPYSNIVYVAQTSCVTVGMGCPIPTCVDLEAQTQGVHGLTCIGNTLSATSQQVAGIYVNASNNSIEGVHIESFWDGIEVGLSGTVANVLLSNVTGTTTGTVGPTKNTVHLCGAHSLNPTSFGTCATYGTVKDITVLHVTNSSQPPTTTIVDDATANAIVSCQTGGLPGCAMPLSTSMYALGEPDAGSTGNPSYSKFTDSPTTPNGNYNNSPSSSYMPTWGVGIIPPSGQNLCSPVGAIYSNTQASGKSVYVCTPVAQTTYGQWTTIP